MRHFRKNSKIVIILALAVLAGGFWAVKSGRIGPGFGTQQLPPGGTPGRAAKPFALEDREGNLRRLSEFKGSVVLLHFWASWCPPCIDELPDLIEFARKYEGDGLKLVAISLDPSWTEAMTIFPEKNVPENVISLIDPESRTSNDYGSYEFPETYLIDTEQRIVTKWIGPQKWEADFFDRLVRRFL